MFLDSKRPVIGAKAIIVLVVFAVFALPLAQESDGFSGSTSITTVGKVNTTFIRSQQEDKIKLAPPGNWRDQAANFNPCFFKVDYKQNLLVWPVVAGNVTRSPPFSDPISFSGII
ncbi:MAG TPA: hypothetical protein VEG60_26845 [Candidatus Binatia bacterium]|nr:hypothetical protein [Candidatus Binatia bacterium]